MAKELNEHDMATMICTLQNYYNKKEYDREHGREEEPHLTLDATLTEWAALAVTASQIAKSNYPIPHEHFEAVQTFWAEYQDALTSLLAMPRELQKIAMIPGMGVVETVDAKQKENGK